MNKYAINPVWSNEDAIWVAEAPDLRRCTAHGDTPEAAVAQLSVGMEAWLEVAREQGMPIPIPRYHTPADAAE